MRKLLPFLIALLVCLPAAAQKPDRTRPPQVGRPVAMQPPLVVERKLGNGIPVLVVERKDVPVVALSLVLNTGTSADPVGRYGLANLTASLLDEGAGSRNALQLADELDFLGAGLSAGAGWDSTSVDLYVPVARLEPALAVMADLVQRPTFPENELARVKNELKVAFLQMRDEADSIADVAYPRVIFGSHRYGTPGFGTAAEALALTRADLAAFHAAQYRPDNAFFVVVGAISPDQAQAALEKTFGGWKGGPAPQDPKLEAPAQRSGRTIYLVDKPGAAQSEIRIGWVGVPRSTADYYPLVVMNTVLGGSFTSRLNQNLREQHGYTYGAGSRFSMRRLSGPFTALAAVETDKTAPAVAEFFKELTRIRERVPEVELTRAKNNLAYGYPGELETNSAVAGEIAEVRLYGLPSDTIATYVDRILAVTAEDVERVARQYVQPENFAVVIVGDVAKIRPGLEKSGLGQVELIPVDTVLGGIPK